MRIDRYEYRYRHRCKYIEVDMTEKNGNCVYVVPILCISLEKKTALKVI